MQRKAAGSDEDSGEWDPEERELIRGVSVLASGAIVAAMGDAWVLPCGLALTQVVPPVKGGSDFPDCFCRPCDSFKSIHLTSSHSLELIDSKCRNRLDELLYVVNELHFMDE